MKTLDKSLQMIETSTLDNSIIMLQNNLGFFYKKTNMTTLNDDFKVVLM